MVLIVPEKYYIKFGKKLTKKILSKVYKAANMYKNSFMSETYSKK
jgi:hypothetical protein